jgi:hypothetical protein
MNTSIEMPKYKSHKEVWALKIKSIVRDGEGENRESDGSAIITPEEDGYAPFRVESDYLHKHNPQVGGYYVVYQDGYKSFSPAQPFEEGNKLITNQVNFGVAIEAAKQVIESLQQSEWVSVEDRLPETGENVFAVLDGEVCVMAYFDFNHDGEVIKVWGYSYDGINGDAHYDDNYEPTHWKSIDLTPPNR